MFYPLSELCYDTHTKCEACRGQVCSVDSFCIECEGWSAEFRKLYLRHKHFTKRVSKKNRKEGKSKSKSPRADPPPPSDDAASTASQESHVTSPVVFMPRNQDLIDANLTVEQLQTPPPAQRHASRRTPSPTQRRVASKGSPPPQRVTGNPAEGSSSAKRPLSGGSQSRRPLSRDSLSPRRGSPSPKRRRYEERETVSPPPHHSSRASSREPSRERPRSRSSPRQASPSREEKEADDAPIPATVKAMVEFIKTNFPDAIASPAQKSSRSFDVSASVGVTDPATPSGSLLGWSQVMSDSFSDTQKKFSQRIQEGRTCHTLLPSLHRLEKVANSPTQGKELTANPDVLDLLKNKVPDFRHLPISIKEGVALERTEVYDGIP